MTPPSTWTSPASLKGGMTPGNGHRCAQPAPQLADRVDVGVGRREVGGDAVEGQDEVLDLLLAERHAQQPGDAPAGEQRDQRQRVVAQRIVVDEGDAKTLDELVVRPARADAGGDDGAHAGAADQVDRHARGAQRLDDADMGEGARAAARHDDAHGMAGQQPRQPVDVGMDVEADMMVLAVESARQHGRGRAGRADRGLRAAAPARGGGGTPRRSAPISISKGTMVGRSSSPRRTTIRQSAWRRQSSVHSVAVGSAR